MESASPDLRVIADDIDTLKYDLQAHRQTFELIFGNVEASIRDLIVGINDRVEDLYAVLEAISERINEVEEKVDTLEGSLSTVTSQLTTLGSKLTDVEDNLETSIQKINQLLERDTGSEEAA